MRTKDELKSMIRKGAFIKFLEDQQRLRAKRPEAASPRTTEVDEMTYLSEATHIFDNSAVRQSDQDISITTSQVPAKLEQLQRDLQREEQKRQQAELQLASLKQQTEEQDALAARLEESAINPKMEAYANRFVLISPVNYTCHPDY